jgi:hypothetical protein
VLKGRRIAGPRWRGRLLPALLVAVVPIVTLPGDVSAQGLFDWFFGGPRQEPEQQPPPDAPANIKRAPAAAPSTPGGPSASSTPGTTGSFAYCVRLCDGRYFPLQRSSATPEKLCGMLCPASQTKVFYGSEIEAASAKDGGRYPTLANAYLYRKKEVANCTCNGKDQFGLAPIDLASDPTLRAGDIVSKPASSQPPAAPSPPPAKR